MPEQHKHFKCPQCGGDLEFSPGATAQKCQYCEHEIVIPQSEAEIKELDFHEYLANASASEDMQEITVVTCQACAASITLDPNITSDECPYCASTLVVTGGSVKELKPKSLLPFKITKAEGLNAYKKWIKSLWFAPDRLKQFAKLNDKLAGIYIPYWTYDANTTTWYTGQRGEDYYVTEHYTTTVNGKTVSKTRQVRKTRWYPASGVVWNSFDDILVLASKSLPKKHADKLEPWDLHNLEPYNDAFLSGFRTESYQVELEEGMDEAKTVMDEAIQQTVKRDIGGDHQRIHSTRSQYDNVKFKHILLPIWLSAYRFNSKVYRFLVNGRTGEVQGERPYSWIKITLTVLLVIAVIAAIGYWFSTK
jgi:DNA-directed RNA polymerase subunit RPC12/RpoP